MAGVLVVDLPGGDVRVGAVALGEDAGDADGLGAVAVVAEAVVAARAEAARPALPVMGQHVRVPVEHPARRRRGRGAEHDLEARGAERLDGAVEPVEAELAGRGLEPAPGELADPDPGEAGGGHPGGVLGQTSSGQCSG